MNTAEMSYILAINEKRNISKAADYLGISQAALSKSVKKIESILNSRLFARLPRGVVPTPEGEIYIEHFKNILDQLEKAKLEVQKLKSDYTEKIIVSIHPVLAKSIVPRIEQALRNYHGLSLEYVFQKSRQGVEQVLSSSIDMAIAADVFDYPDIVKTKLWKEFIGLYSLDGKNKETLILNSEMISAQKLAKQIGASRNRHINDYEILRKLLHQKEFMGLIPNPLAEEDKKLKLIKKTSQEITVSLIYRADRMRSKSFKKIIQLIKINSKKA